MSSGPSFGITSFHIEGFRGIKNASVEDIPADTKWIFLTGKNGGGKTSVLQALFVGLLGKKEGNIILEEGNFKISLKVIASNNDKIEFSEDGLHKHYVSSFGSGNPHDMRFITEKPVIAYGASRTQLESNNVQWEHIHSRSQSLFGLNGSLLNIESELKNWTYRSSSLELKTRNMQMAEQLRTRSEKLSQLLLRLMPNMLRIEVDIVQDEILYFEKDDLGLKINEPKTFLQLASGNRSIIAMIGDLVIRLFQVQDKISDPSDLEGIVIIDELDVHLHPTWQKALPGLLSEIFPKIQFIASTHSPIPLLGAPKESVVLKVHQGSEEGITVEKLDIDVTRLLPNSLLTSPIFDFEEIIPTANTSPKDLLTEDSFQEAMANEEIKNRLKKIALSLK